MDKIDFEKIGKTLGAMTAGVALVGGVLDLLDKEISLPTIPGKTMGGEVFWRTLREYDGWRLQQNEVTCHARILDDEDVRRAYGTINGMYREWERFAEMGFSQRR